MKKQNTIECPDHYRIFYSIDLQKDKKLSLLINGLALLIAAIMIVVATICMPITALFESSDLSLFLLRWAILIVGLLLYIVLHELMHGIFMKLFSGTKVNYGFTGLYAFAASESFFNKKHYVIIALSPIVILGAVLFIINSFVPASWFWVVYFIQVCNISGAAGDLYVTLKMSKMPSDILVQDAGVSMTVYARTDEPAA